MMTLLKLFVAVAVVAYSVPGFAANYPLELVSPRAVGSTPIAGAPAITAGNRIFKAYPGIEYNIRAVVVGGAYPFQFALSGAPDGMTINPQTGEIRWPNPTGTTVTPTITLTDAEGTVRTSPWTITVTTAGFKFVDAVNGSPSGTGAINSPYRTISNLMNASPSDIVYFRSGTYNALDMTRTSVGSAWERIEFTGPNIWIAYPGESPLVDFGFVQGGDPGVIIRFDQDNLYLDGLETRNSRIIGFQTTIGDYGVVRRMRMRDHNTIRANLDGSNAAFIMTVTAYGQYGRYLTIQDNDFSNAPADMALKIYSQQKMLIESNTFRDMFIGVELKDDIPQFSYRANRHSNISGRWAIGGNMHEVATSGEILFNLVNAPAAQYALDVNSDSMARRIDIYRNTFIGRVRVRNTDSADGPFRFYNNVIVSSDSGTPAGSHIYHETVSDASRVTQLNDLTGFPNNNIVDAAGNLTGANVQYIGTRGHQVSTGPYPRPPTSLSAQ